jgi:hypothetical protein
MGSKDQQPASVDPKESNNFYVPTNNSCMEAEPQARTHTQQGMTAGLDFSDKFGAIGATGRKQIGSFKTTLNEKRTFSGALLRSIEALVAL